MFDFLDGAAETEITARRNTLAFESQALLPKCLVDVSSVDMSVEVLGQNIDWPLICSATGASRIFHPEGELAVARAAARNGTIYSLATGATQTIEAVAAEVEGPKIFQLYVYKDRDITWELLERSKRAGYSALCITVDTARIGKRERDLKWGFTVPPKFGARTALGFACHPAWVLGQLISGPLLLANFTERAGRESISAQAARLGGLDPSLRWRDVRDIVDRWGGPVAVKGLMRPDDAARAVDAGASAVIVSNHGGRQLDGAAGAFDVLADIADAVGQRTEVILDGGIRRGVHILKALALGAKACSIGRPYLYGLAAGGEAGASRALEILRAELVLAMQLAGCPNLQSIDRGLLKRC